MTVTVLTPGPLTTVQDAGRTGHAAEGYPECGVCDRYAYALGTLLCGGREGDAALEMTLCGASVRFDGPAVIALTGAAMRATLNGVPVPMNAPVEAPAGGVLAIGPFVAGLRGYLCVRGGIDVPPVLGSRATDLKCRIGGLEGRALRQGDVLPAGSLPAPSPRMLASLRRAADVLAQKPWLLRPRTPHAYLGSASLPLLRAVPGPQDDAFTPAGLHTFFTGLFTLSPDSNRMGLRLAGPAIGTKAGADILSDGILEGSVQVAAGGQPILLLADHQTTGGYAKIATVIPPDIPAAAQLRPGETVAFRAITAAQGVRLCRETAQQLHFIKELICHD